MSNSNFIAAAAAAGVGPSDPGGGAPPLPRRPKVRVREVSSRFMSPAHSSSSSSSSSSAGDLHTVTMKSPISRSKQPQHSSKPSPSPSQRRVLLRSQDHETFSSSSSSHENIPDTFRSMDTPFNYAKPDSFSSQQRKSAVKLFKENDQMQISKSSSSSSSSSTIRKSSSRPDTPSVSTADRIVPSRFRQPQRQTSSSVSDAAKLLQSSFSSSSSSSSHLASQNLNESESIQGGSCPNSPLISQPNRTNTLPDTTTTTTTRYSSMTYEDTLSTTRSSNSFNFSTPSLCSRSLNLPLANNPFKTIGRTISSSISKENRTLPPQPTSTRTEVDSRKLKKTQSSQEQMHSLKLLHNHYLLWRFANAKAQVSMNAQQTQIQNQFFSLGADISQLRDTVKRKQVELAELQQIKVLSTILEAQMPYLDEWSSLEEGYTHSLSGTTSALTNSLLRLPVSGNVQVNIKEAGEALDLAVKITDMIVHHMQTFLPKAEEMDTLMSELANVIDVEKALVEECGGLLTKTQTLEMEDCSLRGHLMQLRCSATPSKTTVVTHMLSTRLGI